MFLQENIKSIGREVKSIDDIYEHFINKNLSSFLVLFWGCLFCLGLCLSLGLVFFLMIY